MLKLIHQQNFLRSLHYGTEWVLSVGGAWHWAKATTCKSIHDHFEAMSVQVSIKPPDARLCNRCLIDYYRWRRTHEYFVPQAETRR